MSPRHRLAVFLLAAPLFAACENTVSVSERPCEVATDCQRNEACVRGLCVSLGGDGGLPPLVTPDGGTPGDDAGGEPPTPLCTVENEAVDCGPGAFCAVDGACAPLPPCGGGQTCPSGLACDEESGSCARPATGCTGAGCGCNVPADCDDGVFCNGAESCDAARGECVAGASPCSGALAVCDEDGDACVACLEWYDCPGFFDECIDNACVCVPDCTGRECGDDGCGGTCGPGCQANALCGDDGLCGCVPDCTGKVCGSDGCGGSCGACGAGEACNDVGQCACAPDCSGRECGDDGCGGSCGACPEALQACDAAGQCVYTGVVCDALTDVLDVSGYEQVAGSLSELADQVYEWDGRPERFLDNFALTDVVSGQSVTIDLTGDFDTYLYLYDVSGGTCTVVDKNDDVATGDRNSQLTFTVGSGSYQVVATTFFERAVGNYSVSTTADLCGVPVADAATYAKCFPKRGDCTRNLCVDYGNSAEFCCVTATCRDIFGSSVVTVQQDAQTCTPTP